MWKRNDCWLSKLPSQFSGNECRLNTLWQMFQQHNNVMKAWGWITESRLEWRILYIQWLFAAKYDFLITRIPFLSQQFNSYIMVMDIKKEGRIMCSIMLSPLYINKPLTRKQYTYGGYGIQMKRKWTLKCFTIFCYTYKTEMIINMNNNLLNTEKCLYHK